MLKILFCGPGYGAGNIGDDAILAGLLAAARRYLPEDTQYGAISYNPEFTKKHTNLDYVGLVYSETKEAFEWSTHIVIGGATLLGDWGIPRCVKLIRLAGVLKRPMCMLGVGVTDLPTEGNLRLLQDWFGYLDMITVRSKTDREIAISYGLSSEKIYVGADGAFAIDCRNIWHAPKGTIGINLVDEYLSEKYPYVHIMEKFLMENPCQSQFTFICGETRKEERFDFVLLRDLYQQFEGKFVYKYTSYLEFLRVLAKCNFVITMRMHLVIFCALTGTPCIPIVRERKTKLMAGSLGLSKILTLDTCFFDFNSLVLEVQGNPEKAIADKDKVGLLKKRAFDNGLWLQKWLEGRFTQ